MKNPVIALLSASESNPPDELAERILDAAYEQFCVLGIRRSSMEDVARRADVGRVTIYRRFESKDKLVTALMAREVRTAITKVAAEHARGDDIETRWIGGFLMGMKTIRKHRLLLALLETEPESILPLLTSKAGNGLALARNFLAYEIRRSRAELSLPSDDAEMIGEIFARLVLSLVLTPATTLPVDDDEGARDFARRHIVPMVVGKAPKLD